MSVQIYVSLLGRVPSRCFMSTNGRHDMLTLHDSSFSRSTPFAPLLPPSAILVANLGCCSSRNAVQPAFQVSSAAVKTG